MTDPDAPDGNREWQHWLVVNIPGNNVDKGQTLTQYAGPYPPSGIHRYVVLVYKQKTRMSTSNEPKITDSESMKRAKTQPIDGSAQDMSQSKGAITSGQQLVYITQWFTEMSEMQTQDFMKCLLNKYAKSGQQMDTQLVNGFSQLGVSDRPASIFQCRIKLFTDWFLQWSDEEKQELLIRLRNIDSKFMDEFQSNIESANTTGAATDDFQSTGSRAMNGNIDDDSKSSEQLVMNGLNSDQTPDTNGLTADEEEEAIPPPESEPLVEPTVDLVLEAQEEEVVVTNDVVKEEVECLMKGTDEPMVNNNNNETSAEVLQEVCG